VALFELKGRKFGKLATMLPCVYRMRLKSSLRRICVKFSCRAQFDDFFDSDRGKVMGGLISIIKYNAKTCNDKLSKSYKNLGKMQRKSLMNDLNQDVQFYFHFSTK